MYTYFQNNFQKYSRCFICLVFSYFCMSFYFSFVYMFFHPRQWLHQNSAHGEYYNTNTPSNIHSPQLVKRITVRRAPNAGAAASTPHGVFNPLQAQRRPGRVWLCKNSYFLSVSPQYNISLAFFVSMLVTSRESCWFVSVLWQERRGPGDLHKIIFPYQS